MYVKYFQNICNMVPFFGFNLFMVELSAFHTVHSLANFQNFSRNKNDKEEAKVSLLAQIQILKLLKLQLMLNIKLVCPSILADF